MFFSFFDVLNNSTRLCELPVFVLVRLCVKFVLNKKGNEKMVSQTRHRLALQMLKHINKE